MAVCPLCPQVPSVNSGAACSCHLHSSSMVQQQQRQQQQQNAQQNQRLQQPTTTAQAASSRPAQPAAPTSLPPRHQQQQQHRQQDRQQPMQQDLHTDVSFVRASDAHIAAFEAIQHAAYPAELWEERPVFQSILRHGCSFVAVQGAHKHVVGYLLIHAVPDPSSPPPLNHTLPPPPPASQQAHLFVHDLCLLPSHHGGGLGARFVRHALAHLASRAASFSCVALPHAMRFWLRQGFEPARVRPHRLPDCYPHGSQLLARPTRHASSEG